MGLGGADPPVGPDRVPPPPDPLRVPAPPVALPRPLLVLAAATEATRGAATAAASTRPAREPAVPEPDGGMLTEAVEGRPSPTCGQPRNATIVLASTNNRAATANREPDVPKPARYARAGRTWDRYRLAVVMGSAVFADAYSRLPT